MQTITLQEKLPSFIFIKVIQFAYEAFQNVKQALQNIITLHTQKLNLYLFQNDVALHFELYWKRENVVDINFWCYIHLID